MKKKYKIEVTHLGTSSYLAYCQQCDWNYEKLGNNRDGQKAIRQHVAETGHTVILEKNDVTEYELANENAG